MKTRPRVMIVDDDKNTREGLQRVLTHEYDIILADSAENALQLIAQQPIDIMLSDVRMPGMDGMTLLQRVMARTPPPVCIMLTAYGSVEVAVEAMKHGAYDFLMKPVNLDHLELLIKRALHTRDMEHENQNLKAELDNRYGLEKILGHARPMHEVFDIVRQAAPTQVTIMLLGESGTGKELVAHAIHGLSPRKNGPFIAVHCAALSTTLLESELFGHEKGAFTGASERRRGRFEMADGGTLFLDEVSEIDPSIQVKLLRVLEERKFERVGGNETIDVDIRLIAASNRDLKGMVEQGKFRQDLFFRLDVVNITLPPLRERIEDVTLLSHHFIREFAKKDDKPVDEITPEALQILSSYNWPGNVRELRNVIERMVVMSRSNKLTARDIPPALRNSVTAQAEAVRLKEKGLPAFMPESLDDAERTLIHAALKKSDGNRTTAARNLGISRRTLQRKLKEYQGGGTDAVDRQGTPPPSDSSASGSVP